MGPPADPLHAGEVNAVAERSLSRSGSIRRGGVVSGVGRAVGRIRLVNLVGLVHERVGRHEKGPCGGVCRPSPAVVLER